MRKPILEKININWTFVFMPVAMAAVLSVAIFLFFPLFSTFVNWGADFRMAFKPAALLILSGQSPYSLDGFFSLPWTALLYLPFIILPPPFDILVLIAFSLLSFGYVAHRFGANPIVITALLATPQLLWGVVYGNNDFMVALGLVLPPQIGLILLMTKPQAGLIVSVFIIWEAWRSGGIRQAAKVCAPLGILCILSVALYGSDLLFMFTATTRFWNISGWPHLLPVGLVLVYKALKEHKRGLALIAGPFVSPYVAVQSLPIAILGLLPNQIETLLAIFALWIVWIVKGPV